jgi:EAL domain-containing protein (putative c-di-GMP-specific phosphodiesterase class I)
VILLEDVIEASGAAEVAERITEELQTTATLEGRDVFVSPSIGISLGTTASDRAEDLLRNADTALHQAKSLGKARHAVFDSNMYASVLKRLRLESDLRRALEQDEFRVYYQPIMKLGTNLQHSLRFSGSRAIVARRQRATRMPQIVGMEAMLRWEHPDMGLISPNEFVPVAEESGLIVAIGRWVLEQACLQTRRWNEECPGNPPLTVCVNLSAKQFQDPRLAQDVARTLYETGLDRQCLCLEITESVVMKAAQSTIATLQELKGLGVELSVDDFGTGYSSLSYLKRFPVDYLKIDRSFVEELRKDTSMTSLVSGIIQLGHSLGMQVVAEGVEIAEQLKRLHGLGCDLAQGFYFSEAVPGEAMPGLLADVQQKWSSSILEASS